MGKNTNQITTWADLTSIGYRLPDGISDYSKECVTYGDLMTMHTASSRLYKTYNAKLDYSYYGGSQNFTISVPTTSQVGQTGNSSIVQRISTSGTSATQYYTLYTFTSKTGLSSGTIYLPNMYLYVTLAPTSGSGTIPTGTLYYRITVKVGSPSGGYIANTSYTSRAISATTQTQIFYEMPSSFSGMSGIDGATTYYVVLEWYTNLTNYAYYGLNVSFHRSSLSSSSYVKFYSSQKCVPWNRIVGYNGQIPPSTPTSTTGARVPVHCYIEEHVSGKTKANTVSFYYCYQLSGSTTWNQLETGRINLGSDGKVDGSASGTCYVLVNPKPSSGTVVSDYLIVKCYECGGNQTWKYKSEYNGSTPTSWTAGSNKAATFGVTWVNSASLGSYNNTIRQLTGMYFYID